jgi:hypothetical protein
MKDETSEACSTHGMDEKCRLGNMKRQDHSEDLGIDGKYFIMGLREVE